MKKAKLCPAGGMWSIEMNAEKTGNAEQQRSYFEVVVPNESNIGMLMQSEGQATVYYDGATGEVLDTNKKTVRPCTPLLPGSTVGINIWSIKEELDNQNFITVSKDGIESNVVPFTLKGMLIPPTIYVDNEELKVVVNVDSKTFKNNPGNV